MSVVDQVYNGLVPEELRPAARSLFYLVHPGMSWRKRRRVDRTTEAFVEQFFEDEAAYRAYEREFFEGPIVDICQDALARLPDEETIYDAHRDECAKLYALVRKFQPETVVETGVYHGVSTASLLLALDRNDHGVLYSIDDSGWKGEEASERNLARTDEQRDPARRAERPGRFRARKRPSCAEPGTHLLPADREPGWIIPADLHDRWTIRVGDPRRELPPLLASLGGLDLFFQDSVHSTTGMLFEFELAWTWLRPGGLLVSPHVDWNDAFETFVDERPCEHGLASFEYNGREDYEHPCSCGYAIKPEV